jgi:ribosomal protein L7/L12
MDEMIDKLLDRIQLLAQELGLERQRRKEAVDQVYHLENKTQASGFIAPPVVDELMKSLRTNQKISAIKAYRTLTGYGLKESKDAVEQCFFNNY